MTEKEKEIFMKYLDSASCRMVKDYASGSQAEKSVSTEVFIKLTGLWNELNNGDEGV